MIFIVFLLPSISYLVFNRCLLADEDDHCFYCSVHFVNQKKDLLRPGVHLHKQKSKLCHFHGDRSVSKPRRTFRNNKNLGVLPTPRRKRLPGKGGGWGRLTNLAIDTNSFYSGTTA